MTTNFDDSVNVNIDKGCGLPKVVDNYPKEISSCAERNNFTNNTQWVGGNTYGDFFIVTCECGKISKPFFRAKDEKNT